jgi:iron(III) transport system substrate-binding protein
MARGGWKNLVAVGVVLGVLLGVACAAAAGAPRADVLIYNSMFPDTEAVIRAGVERGIKDVDFIWFHAGTEQVMAKLYAEIEAGRPKPDILAVTGYADYLILKKRGLLVRYESPHAKALHPSLKDADGTFTAIRVGAMGIAYNTKLVKPADAPKRWTDLLDPKWKGKVLMPNPLLSGSAFVTVTALAKKHGWDYFKKLRDNGVIVEAGNTAVERKLAGGEKPVAILLEENVIKVKKAGDPMEYVYPADGNIIIPSPVAILSTSKTQDAAKKLYDYLLSPDGQKAFVLGWLHPVRSDVKGPEGAQPLAESLKNSLDVDWEYQATKSDEIKERFRSLVLE